MFPGLNLLSICVLYFAQLHVKFISHSSIITVFVNEYLSESYRRRRKPKRQHVENYKVDLRLSASYLEYLELEILGIDLIVANFSRNI